MQVKGNAVVTILLLTLLVFGCKFTGSLNSNSNSTTAPAANSTNTNTANASASPSESTKSDSDSDDDTITSGTGTEKEKPEAGKANVQGKVFYNEKPAEGVQVKLCEKFNRYFGGCGGETYTAKTDAEGEYLIKNVPPRVYEGLIVKVFNTDFYVFATSGIVGTAKYKVDADKTFFAPDTNLFKQDLKLTSPKAGAKIGGDNIEIKWDNYPDAAYYKLNVYADTSSGASPNYDYINRRVDDTSFALDKPLAPGSYTCKVSAYNGNDIKLAESADDIKFTVTGGATK